jgi:hypothetical protein
MSSRQCGRALRTAVRFRRGTTLTEVAVSSLLVAIVLVTSLRATSVIHSATAVADQQVEWQVVADQIVEELRGLAYEEPDGASSLGADTGESTSDRSTWDDCDDANGYRTDALMRHDGQPWGDGDIQVEIRVARISPATLQVTTRDVGLKDARVRVGNGTDRDVILDVLVSKASESRNTWLGTVDMMIERNDKTAINLTASPRNKIVAP